MNSPYYESDESHLPINPPINPGQDIDVATGGLYTYRGPSVLDIANCHGPSGELVFEPRLRETVQDVRFAYDQPKTKEEYEAALEEAYRQADSLSARADVLKEEADRWYDRAYTLEMEFYNHGW